MTNKAQHRTEHELILNLLRKKPDQDRTASLIRNGCDWRYIFQTAKEHNIIPILYKSIGSHCSELLSAEAREKFQAAYKEIATFNFARSTQLIKLVDQLEKYNLPVIAYKGMALAEFAYRDTTLRQFGDIDLFIRKKDFSEVKKRLVEIGCTPAWDLNEDQEKAVLKHYYEYPFFYGENKTLIELHWAFVESFFAFDFEIENIWERTAAVDLYGRTISTLSAEDYLIILCSHGSKHFWKRLSWICDVAKLIENKAIDWQTVNFRASKYGSLRMVRLGTYLAQTIFEVKLPDAIGKVIRADKTVKRLGEKFLENTFAEEREPSEWTEMAKTHLLMRENVGTKMKYSYRLFTTKLIDKLFMPMGRPQ